MKKDDKAYKKRRSMLYSFFVFCSVCLLSGCSSLSTNSSSTTSSSATSARSSAASAKIMSVATKPAIDAATLKAQSILKTMSPDDKIAQMIMVEFVGTDYVATGLQQIVAQHVGGVLYQPGGDSNFDYPNNTIASVSAYSAQINADETIAPFIAIDQEGGEVDKVSGPSLFDASPSAEALAQSETPNQVYIQAKKDASELKQLGINVDLAPVVDVGPDTNLMVSRMFSSDSNIVTSYAGAFVKGLQDNGIPGTLKHFPGLGSVPNLPADDPHNGLYTVQKSLNDLQSSDFAPYQKIIQQDNPAMVMTTDVVTQALDATTPAELSPKVIAYLRNTLHFNGVIITDGMYMKGLYNGAYPSNDQLTQASIQAIEAGNDIVEGPSNTYEISGIISGVEAEIQQGKLSQSQIDQSVLRILKMKIKYGIIK